MIGMLRRMMTLSLLVWGGCPSGTNSASTTLATDATASPTTTGSMSSSSTSPFTSGPDPGPQNCSLRAPVECSSDEGVGDVACPPFCTNLVWFCPNFPPRCEGLVVVEGGPGPGEGSEVVDSASAECAIHAMLGVEPAWIAFSIDAGANGPGGDGALFAVGDGTAMIQWDSECVGDFAYSVRSGRLTILPDFLSACLVAPTKASLAACLFGGNQVCRGEWTWTPPWSTGEYSQQVPPACTRWRP